MGDPRINKKKFTTPKKAWGKERIDQEKELIKEYYFKNKAEIWKLNSKLRGFARQAKKLISLDTEQSKKEKKQLLDKLNSLGLISAKGTLDDALGITIKDLVDRRLQSIVFKKGFAKTMKQSRQFIVHGHIVVEDKKVTSPNFLVPKSKEDKIKFSPNSELSDKMHPERIQEKKLPKKPKKKEEKSKKEIKNNKKDNKNKETKKEDSEE